MPVLFFGGGLSAGGTIRRTIAPRCPTLLDAFDDTGDSATDFSVASPNPRNNASPPVEEACDSIPGPPDTEITDGPKPKTHSKKATFEFTSTTPNSSFECNLDGSRLQALHVAAQGQGQQEGQARLPGPRHGPGGQVDPAPAQADWKVKHRKHKP